MASWCATTHAITQAAALLSHEGLVLKCANPTLARTGELAYLESTTPSVLASSGLQVGLARQWSVPEGTAGVAEPAVWRMVIMFVPAPVAMKGLAARAGHQESAEDLSTNLEDNS